MNFGICCILQDGCNVVLEKEGTDCSRLFRQWLSQVHLVCQDEVCTTLVFYFCEVWSEGLCNGQHSCKCLSDCWYLSPMSGQNPCQDILQLHKVINTSVVSPKRGNFAENSVWKPCHLLWEDATDRYLNLSSQRQQNFTYGSKWSKSQNGQESQIEISGLCFRILTVKPSTCLPHVLI